MNRCYIVRTKFTNLYDGSESFGVDKGILLGEVL